MQTVRGILDGEEYDVAVSRCLAGVHSIGRNVHDRAGRHVDFLTGYGFSNVLLASLLSAVNAKTFIISANAGPSQIAGEQCSPYFFSTSWQGDQAAQATGEYLNQKGVKTLFLIDPNYAAGKDVAAGVKANFKGEVIGDEYTPWPSQLDFSAELTKARAARPEAIFAFFPARPAFNS